MGCQENIRTENERRTSGAMADLSEVALTPRSYGGGAADKVR